MSTDYDIAVVGAGVAGLTAARVAAEAGQRVIAYDRLSPGGQLVNLTTVHDYPEPGGSAESWGLISELVARTEAAGVTMSFDEVTRVRSEEHTSELQSQSNLVCRLLLEKKKKQK